MKLLCVSDTHGNTEVLRKVIDLEKEVDFLFHGGDFIVDTDPFIDRDLKIIKVKGNCDHQHPGELEKVVEVADKRILLTHGHKYNVKYNALASLAYRAAEIEADIVLFGHTHRSFKLKEDNVLYLNPGSLAYPRDGVFSYAIIEISKTGIKAEIKTVDSNL
ncbi:metallophosphoesterase [Fuchsiella alkaliacetigena]|uniref:metallophosphoesterase n=1 Tax=Fuchsiella alkaliacetigena TaxID=957042 RepID=UPI00200B4021|nr:metallophosphoesterase [Fuchsiella alkaliacetigena]MCK8825340.1 metallophosphoesterase [Fuchsiella alkaliacetigena]